MEGYLGWRRVLEALESVASALEEENMEALKMTHQVSILE